MIKEIIEQMLCMPIDKEGKSAQLNVLVAFESADQVSIFCDSSIVYRQ